MKHSHTEQDVSQGVCPETGHPPCGDGPNQTVSHTNSVWWQCKKTGQSTWEPHISSPTPGKTLMGGTGVGIGYLDLRDKQRGAAFLFIRVIYIKIMLQPPLVDNQGGKTGDVPLQEAGELDGETCPC